MTAKDFAAWLDHMKLKKRPAAEALGISRNSVDRYLENGAPRTVALACAAIAFGLPPWSQKN